MLEKGKQKKSKQPALPVQAESSGSNSESDECARTSRSRRVRQLVASFPVHERVAWYTLFAHVQENGQ